MNIKINETIISNVDIVDSGDVLGIRFNTDMTLTELDNVFNPETSPKLYIVDANGNTTGVYRNLKIASIRVADGAVDIVMLVTKGEISDAEKLTAQIEKQAVQINAQTAQINMQAMKINEQAVQINEQAAIIAAQAEQIEVHNTIIETQSTRISDFETELTQTKEALANAEALLTAMEEGIANA